VGCSQALSTLAAASPLEAMLAVDDFDKEEL